MPESILVTGFEPFAQWGVNSSGEIARVIGERMPGVVRAAVLPVDHGAAGVRMIELLQEVRPRAVLAMGLWAGAAFRIERYGRKCPGLAAVEGVEELEGAWDWEAMERALAGAGWPVIRSEDAGKYVCDTTYWMLLDYRSRWGWPEIAAFLHVPPVGEEWTVEGMAGAVGRVIGCVHSTSIASP